MKCYVDGPSLSVSGIQNMVPFEQNVRSQNLEGCQGDSNRYPDLKGHGNTHDWKDHLLVRIGKAKHQAQGRDAQTYLKGLQPAGVIYSFTPKIVWVQQKEKYCMIPLIQGT